MEKTPERRAFRLASETRPTAIQDNRRTRTLQGGTYLDPPYWGSEDDYGRELFGRNQFEVMAKRLGELKGRFVMSINDVPDVRALFDGFDMIEVALNYTVATGKGVPAKELIIRGVL